MFDLVGLFYILVMAVFIFVAHRFFDAVVYHWADKSKRNMGLLIIVVNVMSIVSVTLGYFFADGGAS